MNAHEMGRAGVGFVAAELERVTAERDEARRLIDELLKWVRFDPYKDMPPGTVNFEGLVRAEVGRAEALEAIRKFVDRTSAKVEKP